MTAITISILASCLCLCLVFFLLGGRKTGREKRETSPGELPIAGLSAVCVKHFDILFRDGDRRELSLKPELRAVRSRLWRDRRRIVLVWFDELQQDVQILWRFHRFLVRSGLPASFEEELAVALSAWFALVNLKLAWGIVFVSGPFAFGRVLRSVRIPVEWLSQRSARRLERASSETRVRLEKEWARRVAALEPL